ncbi:hypothetical protein [Pseudodesulfovibrio karagichevae]|uniref:Uncharacterized protein n=1 Tax=Pseudodesulfovibrio karagichevae TaxID=3239305 RepID=A0ABV4K5E7_9BACT
MDETTRCQECGMPVKAGEFHPYAACLMFKACHNSTDVRGNLAALYQHGYTDGHCAGRTEWKGKCEEMRASLRDLYDAMADGDPAWVESDPRAAKARELFGDSE